MKNWSAMLPLYLMGVAVVGCHTDRQAEVYNQGVNIIPMPAQMTAQPGYFMLDGETTFSLSNDSLQSLYTYFQPILSQSTGFDFTKDNENNSNAIRIQIDPSFAQQDEGYHLNVSPTGALITARSKQGAFYGMQSLLQLLPVEVVSAQRVYDMAWHAPCVTITDAPRYSYRGMMLDVCRHFHDIDFIKRQLDVMAMYKMNRFHWHLTEDQLWTIEIKKYPELTQGGSVRKEPDGTTHQGFYTQEQIKEVVAYAQERFITIIPEIELPGHALAALCVKPELSCTGGNFEVRNIWGVEEEVYCAGNEETFAFLEDVLKEVSALFPGPYIHIGGDECPKDRWNACPKCQARMRKENLKDAHALQSYFVKRIEKVINAQGKKMIGWDEILEGGLAPSATVMSWRGEAGGVEAARMGHDVIMTPGNWLYLNYGQDAEEVEPTTIGFATPLSQTYSYDPGTTKIPDSLQHHVLGAQGNMWTEYAINPEMTEYMLYPRLLAIAELTWSPQTKRDYDGFLSRLGNAFVRLDELGVQYHIPIPVGPVSDDITLVDSAVLTFTNSQNRPMVYRMKEAASYKPYVNPLVLKEEGVVEIATQLPSGKLSPVRKITVTRKPMMMARPVGSLEPGVMLSEAEGKYFYLRDLDGATWSEPKKTEKLNFYPAKDDEGAYIQTGYFEVPADGVYYVNSEMDNLRIDGEQILSNDGVLRRHTLNRASVYLQKGWHEYEVIVISSRVGGFPRAWSPKGFKIANEDGKFAMIESYVME